MMALLALWAIFFVQTVTVWFMETTLLVKALVTALFVIAILLSFIIWFGVEYARIPEYIEGLTHYVIGILLGAGVLLFPISFVAHSFVIAIVGVAMIAIALIELAPAIMRWPQ